MADWKPIFWAFVIATLFAAVFVLNRFNENLTANRITILNNRVVGCQMLLSLSQPIREGDACAEREVARKLINTRVAVLPQTRQELPPMYVCEVLLKAKADIKDLC